MKKVLFLDRDGTLILEPPVDYQVDSLDKLSFYPEVFRYLTKINDEMDYELVIVTNQDCLGTEKFPEKDFWPSQNKMIEAFKNEGIIFADVHIDPSDPKDNSKFRKPNIGMLHRYLNGDYDLKNSYVIGDRDTDITLAKNLGCKGIILGSANEEADCEAKNWKDIYFHLKQHYRKSTYKRKTNETSIVIDLNLDGIGKSEINTGIPFFDHMLDQIAKHSEIDLIIDAKGDIEIDEHHTVEDVAISLGKTIKNSLGKKTGINRYGFCLPMDDCLANVAIDFGGRPHLVWDCNFIREKVGDLPTEMFKHFFKSFSDSSECNLNIKAEGENEHHKIEAIFKGFAKSMKMAKKVVGDKIPSSKGVL